MSTVPVMCDMRKEL